MKKLLNTLFVLSENAYLTLDGENIVVVSGDEVIGRFPLHTLESILSFTYKGASPALMGACMEKNIGLSFFSPQGKLLANVSGRSYGNVLLRKEQYRISDNLNKSCSYAQNMILGKVYNCRWSLERTLRDNGYRVDCNKIRTVSNELQTGLKRLKECSDIDNLRGIEGQLASRYFSVFDDLIINQKEDFSFKERSRRPPLDRVNAVLSFAYTILSIDCANALEAVGLDSYVGFMHRDRPGRQSLALDMMEELRAILADRFVLTLLNTKVLQPKDFIKCDDGAVLLNDKGRKMFFSSWQTHKREMITHPFLKEKVEWGLIPYIQALLLARTIRGDLPEYPPFMWK